MTTISILASGDTATHLPYLQDAWQTIIDPAHITAEVVFTIVTDFLLVGLGWRWVKKLLTRRFEKEHAKIDEEHGYTHVEGLGSFNVDELRKALERSETS